MKIFLREGRVVFELQGKYPVSNRVYYFTYMGNTEDDYKSLLMDNLQKSMHEKIESVRRESYNEGWKDAKAKKAKRSWFSGIL